MAFTFMLVAGTGCVTPTVAPRTANPLSNDSLVVGASGAAGIGLAWNYDDIVQYGTVGGAVTFASPIASVAGFKFEVDGAIGGNRYRDRSFLSAASGLRLWHHIDANEVFYWGIDMNMSGFSEVGRPPRTGLPHHDLMIELRPMLAYQIADGVWLGTRPGIVALTRDLVGVIDAPMSLSVQMDRIRIGAELAAQAPLTYPLPSGLRLGLVIAYELQ